MFTPAHVDMQYVVQSCKSVYVIMCEGDGKRCNKKNTEESAFTMQQEGRSGLFMCVGGTGLS